MKRLFWLTLVAVLIITDIHQHSIIKKLSSPLKPTCTDRVEIVTKVLTAEEYCKALPHGDLVWKTYGHESTFGLHDGCKNQGKYNGFGYGQNKNGYACFDTFEEVARHVSDWFETQLKSKSISNALCYYQSGHTDQLDCEYARYSLNIK